MPCVRTVRSLEPRARPGRTVEELTRAPSPPLPPPIHPQPSAPPLQRSPAPSTPPSLQPVFAELAIKRTRRAADLVAEAIRVARAREPHAEITVFTMAGQHIRSQNWALSAGFELSADRIIPEQAIAAYNQTHPQRPH